MAAMAPLIGKFSRNHWFPVGALEYRVSPPCVITGVAGRGYTVTSAESAAVNPFIVRIPSEGGQSMII